MRLQTFPRYELFDPLVPVHQITDGKRPTIHRFFDSCPISPSGRYIALNEFPYQDRPPAPGDRSFVVVVDLASGEEVYRDSTAAWDTQVGAQVQWGATDAALLFNRMDEATWLPHGVQVDFTNGTERRFEAPVYHVSRDGRFAISPDLVKIGIAQAGYGVHVPPGRVAPNSGAPADDGIFITDLERGESRLLVSLADVCAAIAPASDTFAPETNAVYGFHTKWNDQGTRIMFIVRQFPAGARKGKSRNWLVTLDADGSNIRVAVPPHVWSDGHHPNWEPNGDRIIMNLPPASSAGLFGRMRILLGKIGRRTGLPIGRAGVPLHFRSVRFDGADLRSVSRHQGSGHPTIHPGGGHLMTDCYAYEPMAANDGTVPLRLIDLATDAVRNAVRIDTAPAYKGPRSEYRIDPHPAWDAQGHLLTFNGAVNGVRSVFVADFSALLQ
ncbi:MULTISPECIES: hypothetical protein [unclassified Novosphingobium]|uniref:hypothetical protein n=1 Tax=unclassified Novosphingobium TaxID=2644732 RepID=UPI00086A174C|nr:MULTISPECIES: hypothetical protein [unclassified Novosphingobium]ODU68641.1 MAG: hypothetical protein ABT11_15885 [Novosphingobium sp. SCN 66-18]QCI93111.1 hypothetical protein FA702_05785 [Novosphingobium sp. EMRT-2]RQW45491.1 hypothetical protein EH199_04315 [Novosphingobium sp. LASN5T]